MSSTPIHSLFLVEEEESRTAVRFPAGTHLTEANAEEFWTRLDALTEGRVRPRLSVDLSGVALLSGNILTRLIALHGKVRGAEGQLTLVNPGPSVREVFRLTRLDTVLELRCD